MKRKVYIYMFVYKDIVNRSMNLKKIGKIFTSQFVGAGSTSYEKRIYRAAISQCLGNTVIMYPFSVTGDRVLKRHGQHGISFGDTMNDMCYVASCDSGRVLQNYANLRQFSVGFTSSTQVSPQATTLCVTDSNEFINICPNSSMYVLSN